MRFGMCAVTDMRSHQHQCILFLVRSAEGCELCCLCLPGLGAVVPCILGNMVHMQCLAWKHDKHRLA